jgi:hypothetical protein
MDYDFGPVIDNLPSGVDVQLAASSLDPSSLWGHATSQCQKTCTQNPANRWSPDMIKRCTEQCVYDVSQWGKTDRPLPTMK